MARGSSKDPPSNAKDSAAPIKRDAKVIASVKSALDVRGEDGRPLLKESSAKAIEWALGAIGEYCGPDGFAQAIVSKPKLLHSCICKRWSHPPTCARMISSVVSALKYDSKLGTASTREFWRERLREALDRATLLAKDNVLTSREMKTMPGFDEMRKALQTLSEEEPHASLQTSQEYLWLMIATTVVPKRADWGQLAIVAPKGRVPNGCNALILPPKPKQAILRLRFYKTDSSHQEYTETLSSELTEQIRESLASHPRKFLFVGRDGSAFKSRDSWRQWVQRKFTKHLKHKATVNGLRKIWVQTFANPSESTILEQEELARKMLHTAKTQRDYYFHKVKSNSTTGRTKQASGTNKTSTK